LLSIQDYSIHYGKFEAIKGVSFTIDEKELVSIIGANGAGKTTLIRAICGLKRPSRGKIFFDATDITGLNTIQRVKQGIVCCPEGRKLFPEMSVLENLEMGAYLRDDVYQQNLQKVFSLFPVLRSRRKQRAGSLSGGEQQMLAIGRTLMSSPTLVLFDEPSTGLAPMIARDLMGVIKQLNEEGKTILLVEQNVHLALKISHRGFVIENGQIVLDGSAEDLVKNEEVKVAYLGG